MYKKNSILDRRVRPPSARNVENGPIEYEQQRKRELVRLDKYRRYEELKGWSSRNQWEDPQHWNGTSYEKTHRLQTVVTEHGLETVPRADVDIPSGKKKVPAPWDRAVDVDAERPPAPYSPGAGVAPPRPRPSTAGTPARLLHDKTCMVPEDDASLAPATQRRLVRLPGKMDGTYNPITHRWTVPPEDVREIDREAMPPGMRSKLGHWRS